MSTSMRSANLFAAALLLITATCTIILAGRLDGLVLPLALWVIGLIQIVSAIGPLRRAVADDSSPGGKK